MDISSISLMVCDLINSAISLFGETFLVAYFLQITNENISQVSIYYIIVYALLGIDKKQMNASKKVEPYARVLGVSQKGKDLLSEIVRINPKINMITSVKKYMDTVSNKNLKEMLQTDIYATNVYTLGYEMDSWANLDYTNKIVTL